MTGSPVVRSVRLTPSSLLALHAAHPVRYPVLLESASAGATRGQFDVLFAHPQQSLRLRSDGTLIEPDGSTTSEAFLPALDRWWRSTKASASDSTLPFRGGWFLYLGYELAGQIEPRLQLRSPATGLVAAAVRFPSAIVLEHGSGNAWIVTEPAFSALLDPIAHDISQLSRIEAKPKQLLAGAIEEEPATRYLEATRRALDHIAAGDIYQANLSRAWNGTLQPDVQPHDIYRRLRRTNPGPFCALAVLDDFAIVSSSPERLVKANHGWISTRPIAGTRPRGATEQADVDLVRELEAHPKERAEHVMLIDLERNDLGRICMPGSVVVDEYMTIESYAHVHHIVSNVRGRLRAEVGPGEAIAAVFPGGTITGCPKVRCMEIIAELEDTARGAYTGSLGYLNLDGSMDLNILIRTIEQRGDAFTLRAGAGIVADSIPERELEESRAKARGVLRALGTDEL